jgi:hypothetical protein
MKRSYLLVLALLAITAVPAFAQKVGQTETTEPGTGPTCDLSGYKGDSQVFPAPVSIPDNGRVPVQIGQIATLNDGGVITDCIVDLYIAHTWVGDVVATVEYGDCAGGPALAGVNVICRPRGTTTIFAAPCGTGTGVGCSGNFGTVGTTSPPPAPVSYKFSDDATGTIAEGTCPNPVPSGCYKPQTGGSMSVFDGLLKGGCFRLSVSDWAGADVGTVSQWAVWTTNEYPVSAAPRTWGAVKTMYR